MSIRFLSELTKFELISASQTLEWFKRLTENKLEFRDVEIIALLLKSCGPYLLKHPEIGTKMSAALDSLNRLKQKDQLPSNLVFLLDEGIQACRPTQN